MDRAVQSRQSLEIHVQWFVTTDKQNTSRRSDTRREFWATFERRDQSLLLFLCGYIELDGVNSSIALYDDDRPVPWRCRRG